MTNSTHSSVVDAKLEALSEKSNLEFRELKLDIEQRSAEWAAVDHRLGELTGSIDKAKKYLARIFSVAVAILGFLGLNQFVDFRSSFYQLVACNPENSVWELNGYYPTQRGYRVGYLKFSDQEPSPGSEFRSVDGWSQITGHGSDNERYWRSFRQPDTGEVVFQIAGATNEIMPAHDLTKIEVGNVNSFRSDSEVFSHRRAPANQNAAYCRSESGMDDFHCVRHEITAVSPSYCSKFRARA